MKIKALIMAATFIVACDSKPAPNADTPKEAPPEATTVKPGETVTLAAAGAKFDPAIQPEQLPNGAAYCDMGTVHWAAAKMPADSKCPECGMKLKTYDAKKVAEQKKGAVKAKDGHGHDHKHGDGHDHGDHKHGDGHDHGDHKH